MIRPWCKCGSLSEYWTCCGGPSDGSSGDGCLHDDPEYPAVAVCEECWQELEDRGEVSSASEGAFPEVSR